MTTIDDTIREGKQAREDTWMAMIRAGLLPLHVPMEIADDQDIEDLYRKIAEMGDNISICVYTIPREVAELGRLAGAAVAATLVGMPKNAHGYITFGFDGWADDPRALCEVPEIVEFCRGVLLVDPEKPSLDNAKRVLSILMNEDPKAFKDGKLVDQTWLDAAGGVWVVRTACVDECYVNQTSDGWNIDYDMNFAIYQWMKGEGPPPGT